MARERKGERASLQERDERARVTREQGREGEE